MALSQKHDGKALVPWFCSAEWHHVFNKLYGKESDDNSKRKALEILKVWKARTPLLPCGVEGTFIILEAKFVDRAAQDDYNLRLLLSSAIMRFLNICAAYNKYQGTFFTTARKMNLPEWLISVRHDTAHSQNLPHLDLLDYSLNFCYAWLYREYWKPYSSKTEDFIDTTNPYQIKIFQETLEPLLFNYIYINLLLHPYWNYSKINEIESEKGKSNLIKELNVLDDVEVDENTNITKVLYILWEQIATLLAQYKNKEKFNYVVDILLNDDVFLGNFDDYDQVFDEMIPNELPRKFVFLWNKMLENMHKLGMLEALIRGLLTVLTKHAESHKKKWYAALWLAEIGKGLSKCILAKDIWKDLNKEEIGELSEKQLNKFLKEKCERKSPELENVLDLSFLSPVPEILKNLGKLKSEILDNPNEYTHLFISNLLKVNETLKSTSSVEQITELVKTYTTSEEDAFYYSKIFTVEDLNNAMDVDKENEKQNISDKTDDVIKSKDIQTDLSSINIWRKVININFDKCPIGILPFQASNMNPLI